MEYSTKWNETNVTFTDRWEDTCVIEFDGSGILIGVAGEDVRLEKAQVVNLIDALVKHIAK